MKKQLPSPIKHKQGAVNLLTEGLPFLGVMILYIIIVITISGVASIATSEEGNYYDAALEYNIQRILQCISYSDGYHTHPGIIDQTKLTEDILNTCTLNDHLGFSLTLGTATVVETTYYATHGTSCTVQQTPYSCLSKKLRILLKTSKGLEPYDLIINSILKQTTGKELVEATHAPA